MTHYAVLIGNNKFPNERSLKPLTCPPADVEGMKMVLTAENRGQFLADHVLVLLNKESREVIREINRVLKNASKHDLVLFYYSGHGLPNSQNNLFLSTLDTEADLLESTAVSFNQMYELINTFYCKKIVIILDCCYSGAAGKVFKGDIGSQLQTLNSRATGTFLITATSEIQVALDVNEGSRFSLFTKHLIAGLETGEAAKNDDGLISVDDIFRYVAKKLSFENAKQVPRKFGKNESGELFIAKSGRAVTKKPADTIEHFVLELKKQEKITTPILTSALALLEKPRADFSELEKQRYDLLLAVYESNIEAVEFVTQWNKTSKPVQVIENSPPLKMPKPFSVIQDKMQCGALAPKMVYIPEGRFLMGSPETEKNRFENEKQHEVIIEKPFYMGQFAVTFAEYDLFCEYTIVKKSFLFNTSKTKPNDKSWGRGQRPVINVTWFDAVAYCEWLSEQTGQRYVLPTEAQWEYVCRAGTQTPFSCGETISTDLANFNGDYVYGNGSKGEYRQQTLPVGSFPANPWGLYDMHGNVWEWTCSEYSDYDGSENQCFNKFNAQNVLCGGSWNSNPSWLRSAVRGDSAPDNRIINLGFRLSRM